MKLIKNYDVLAKNGDRKIILDILEAGLESIQPGNIISQEVILKDNILSIKDEAFDLDDYNNVFVLGFGKGSAGISKQIEEKLGEKLSGGYVIDVSPAEFKKIEFTLGTHPLPSKENYKFTENILHKFQGLSAKDLVLVVICGGGSAMLVAPIEGVTLEEKINVNKALLKSGADIKEMNTVRKHLSKVKGGSLAKRLHPATVASLIFSDVPGNDLSFIASGPTVLDTTTIDDAKNIIAKYNLTENLKNIIPKLEETPKDENIFENVINILMLSNMTALEAMKKKVEDMQIPARIYTDSFQSDTQYASEMLVSQTRHNEILLAAGETTVHVTGSGEGGRNQEVVLYALKGLPPHTIVASIASDGWDNSPAAGAIGDSLTIQEAERVGLSLDEYLHNNDSYNFFQKTTDFLDTGRLPSNVSDLFVVYRKE